MKPIEVVSIEPPPTEQRVRREARFVPDGGRKTRYSLPEALKSTSPIGYRHRVSLSHEQAQEALGLLSMERPTAFTQPTAVSEQMLFEELSLGVLSSRQSTNFRGFRQVSFGPEDSVRIKALLSQLTGRETEPLDGASYTHLVLDRPYRNPFTMLLTLAGHRAISSPLTVLRRIYRKWMHFDDDIPTIGYLPHLHVGILADAMERAAVIASEGCRRAIGFMAPFCGRSVKANKAAIRELEAMCGLTRSDRMKGWRMALAVQVGTAIPEEQVPLDSQTARLIGANLLALRSERIQPGVNQEGKAPAQYHLRQDMDVSEEFTVMAGRAAFNAFTHWTGIDRDVAKDVMLLDRIDVLTRGGKARLRAIRGANNAITDRLIKEMPVWADVPAGRAFSRNAERGRKAFALAGQRIYIGGLARREVDAHGLDWIAAVRAVGASASRSALFSELMGTTEVPADCDLLAGICLMAGPVNQNDIGKTYYGMPDLLYPTYPDRDPTSLLVWSFKAKTIADPIGNEEQLMNAARKGALVDLRPGPHEVVTLAIDGELQAMRQHGTEVNSERAFADVRNFVTAPDGRGIAGNEGQRWPHGDRQIWEV